MTMASTLHLPADRASRWLVVASLALNLFFLGLAGAMVVHGRTAPPPAPPFDRSPAARIERIAAALPPADADGLRAAFHARSAAVESFRENFRRSQEAARDILRAEPFDVAAMNAAMAKTRAARATLDEALQNLIATAAAAMSGEGRRRLAEWPPGQRTEPRR